MARSRVVDFDYYQFLRIMQRAGNAGQRIDKTDARWADYVRQHNINEVAATATEVVLAPMAGQPRPR